MPVKTIYNKDCELPYLMSLNEIFSSIDKLNIYLLNSEREFVIVMKRFSDRNEIFDFQIDKLKAILVNCKIREKIGM